MPASATTPERRRAMVPAITYPPELPVSERRDEIAAAIRDNQVVVVAGETGSGKTTQLPKICLELGRGIEGTIAHTQPRRIAARTVAERIAAELGVGLGEAVGYSVRFDDRSRHDTLVRLMTDGLLLAEIQRDRLLRRYDTVIVDEAHERSLNIDFLLGYLRSILPRRPDLKLVITSATIDPARFSAHFGDAPVVEVSGRTYPVETRYRPVGEDASDDRDLPEAIGDAVEELQGEGPGDVLVFLSGEREIRDTAEALEGRFGPRLEVLPLYARLSTPEQQRVFQPHTTRRVVLATNVAETSLTVPGIRYVVDPGTARISRYSARLKVQRLPIEKVSQASADQRKGRCGRTSEGICIRLYSEEDFEARPRFTDPEVLRTNLASVILQMAALRLGPVEEFGFLDPPDRRQVRDGVALLHELGALAERGGGAAQRLTPLGRRLARLPVDPRLARMVLEADRLSCAQEVIVVAAALSIQDVRERPAEQRAQADQQHARFADERSDFASILKLWEHLHEGRRELSGNQFRKRCRAEFLHYLRVREWQDLVGQLRGAARAAGVTVNQQPGEIDQVHVAVLSGLLSHVGMYDAGRREYAGARGARFAIFPGSVIARRRAPWVMAAELVETSRLFGRTAAQIDPKWIEPLAGHLVSRTHSEPRWQSRRGAVVATERVTLYGLPVVTGRTVGYARIDPVASREIFLRRALVEDDWEAPHAFLEENRRRIAEVGALEERLRRRGLLARDDVLYAFFDARVPETVVSGAHFDRWWRDARRHDPDLLVLPRELLLDPEAAAGVGGTGRPSRWRQGDLELDLTYRFAPGEPDDGVTVHVPLEALGALRDQGFDWLVPALRHELVVAYVRMLPKELRRALVPVPDLATEVLERVQPRRGSIADALAGELEALRGVRADPAAFDRARLPAHLRMHFSVHDADGTVLATGDDLTEVRAAVAPQLRKRLTAATSGLERHGLTAWTIGTLPREVELPGAGGAVRGFPALVDEGAAVGVVVFDGADAQAAAMHAGTRRLLALTIPSPLRALRSGLSGAAQLTLATAPHGTLDAVLEDVVTATLDVLLDEAGGPAWDGAGFARLRGAVAGSLVERAERVLAQVVAVVAAAQDVRRAAEALTADVYLDARRDVAAQVGRLVHPGFATAAGVTRLPDVERYLRGAQRRLERLPDSLAVDRDRMGAIRELEAEYRARLEAIPGPPPTALREVAWMLEELRVAQFAQAVGARQVSAKRIRRALADAA